MKNTKFQQFVNILLGFAGICGSFYIIGWVEHPSHLIVGTGCFFLFLFFILISVILDAKKSDKEKK